MGQGFSRLLLELIVEIKGTDSKELIIEHIVDEIVHLFLEGNKEPLNGDAKGRELLLVL